MPFNPRTDMFTCNTFAFGATNALNNSGRLPMVATLADRDFHRAVNKKGREMAVYEVRQAGPNDRDGVFMGYWCPYENQKTRYTTLTRLADYMFTATMDGCSFGIGSVASDGTQIVSHSNKNQYETPDSKAEMISRQKGSLRRLLGPKAKVFEPGGYRSIGKTAGVSALTFGVRSNGRWKFYAHRFRQDTDYRGMTSLYTVYDTVQL